MSEVYVCKEAVYKSTNLLIYLSAYLLIYLSTYLLIYLSTFFLPHGKFVAKYTWLPIEKYNT